MTKIFESFKESEEISELTNDFIKEVLKAGSRDNLFDKFLKKKNKSPELLSDLVKEVTKRLEYYT